MPLNIIIVHACMHCSFKVIWVASSQAIGVTGGMTNTENDGLMARAADIKRHVNEQGGSLVILSQVRGGLCLGRAQAHMDADTV
jgi:hypothetical protein